MTLITIGRRVVSRGTVAAALLPFALLAVLLMICLGLTRTITNSLALSLGGLILDMLGAMTLAGGLILSKSADVRLRAEITKALLGPTLWQRVCAFAPVKIAKRLGPTDADEISASTVQELVDVSWGLVLLFGGFLGQALGAGLQATFCR
jgi:hypothetical protein